MRKDASAAHAASRSVGMWATMTRRRLLRVRTCARVSMDDMLSPCACSEWRTDAAGGLKGVHHERGARVGPLKDLPHAPRVRQVRDNRRCRLHRELWLLCASAELCVRPVARALPRCIVAVRGQRCDRWRARVGGAAYEDTQKDEAAEGADGAAQRSHGEREQDDITERQEALQAASCVLGRLASGAGTGRRHERDRTACPREA